MITKKQHDLLNSHLLTPDKFNIAIEQNRSRFDSYLDTITNYCEDTGLELNIVKKLLNLQIFSKLKSECENTYLIDKTSNTSPLF